ncbi:hypothetical protein EVAR_30084_1 [Eumeta japonica]|uniref:Uncharacterized protein n=1 Tax=Eumeta variegata TaxID=151549 RepID=A0A4C1XCE2_EUMVA|nr:hypothetical protein EVAR_30084_1 [Eumeta japonica]
MQSGAARAERPVTSASRYTQTRKFRSTRESLVRSSRRAARRPPPAARSGGGSTEKSTAIKPRRGPIGDKTPAVNTTSVATEAGTRRPPPARPSAAGRRAAAAIYFQIGAAFFSANIARCCLPALFRFARRGFRALKEPGPSSVDLAADSVRFARVNCIERCPIRATNISRRRYGYFRT